jgi:hypothetical protein
MKLYFRPVLFVQLQKSGRVFVRSPRRFIYRDASLGEWQEVKHMLGPWYRSTGDPFREWTHLFMELQ